MPDQPLEDLVDRLERERLAADRAYNDALTALDRAIQSPPALPPSPPAIDALPIPGELADAAARRPRFALLRSVIWRIIGPPPNTSSDLDRALVDRANRSIEELRRLHGTVTALLEGTRGEFAGLVAFETRLIQYLQTMTAFVDTRDRRYGAGDLRDRMALAEQRMMILKREVEARTGASPGAARDPRTGAGGIGDGDAAAYVGFEDRFRGAQSEIRRRVEDYAPLFAGASDVVDVGCGRGELLDLFRASCIDARGVDANESMVNVCQARGLNVERGDAVGYLEQQADGSIGGLSAIQVVEHFTPGYLARFLEVAYLKMRPGSVLVLETINPACWMAFFETYLRDLTHQRPLHPDTLQYLVEASGFSSVNVQYRSPVTEGDRLDRVEVPSVDTDAAGRAILEVALALNAHADKLNARLFSSMDYAIVARR